MNDQLASSLGQLSITLIAMVCLMVGVAWLAKRTKGFGFQGGKRISIIESLALGSKERVVLVNVNGQQILLGVTASQINSLWVGADSAIMPDPKIIKNTAKENFSESLKKIIFKEMAN